MNRTSSQSALFFVLMLSPLSLPILAQRAVRTPVTARWEFREVPPSGVTAHVPHWTPAAVPGDVHLDLLASKEIADPFTRDNEQRLQWIGASGWEYRTTLPIPVDKLRSEHLDLVFNGLDSAATVSVNGHVVLMADNAFRTWRCDVKPWLHAGDNDLLVTFESPLSSAKRIAAADRWHGSTPAPDKSYLRKPAYEYGWDWGPTFVTSGITDRVWLESWGRQRVENVYLRQRNLTQDVGHVEVEATVHSDETVSASVLVLWSLKGQAGVPSRSVTANVTLVPGSNVISVPVEIHKPSLWYPNGYGAQPLYQFKVSVLLQKHVQDERTEETGLRTVVLRRDQDAWGRSFEFVINGIPVYAKGASVIPFDSFPSRVDEAQYRYILQSAKDSNMNMLRQWGGGYYGTDAFYRLADEMGIMVWQDFMFGNDWQPGTSAFRKQVEAEATDQVTRLRNHPSLVLWCGNNETEEALRSHKNVDAVKQLDTNGRVRVWQDYLLLFSSVLPDVVARLDAETPYWPSSPSKGYEDDLPAKGQTGDSHNWDVWHGRVPFSDYRKHHERFVSEYGFQSFPEWKTVLTYTDEGDRKDVFTPVMLVHQKSGIGNSVIHDYMLKDYSEPKDMRSFLYVSQVLQAEGVKIGAEHLRTIRPQNMGSLFWQLNDCWPVASWASIDYDGRWKALQFYARRFYSPLLVSPQIEDGAVKVYIVSDQVAVAQGQLRVRVLGFDGKVVSEFRKAVTIAPLASAVYHQAAVNSLLPVGTDPTTTAVAVDLFVNGAMVSSNLTYLVPTKSVHLPKTHVSLQVEEAPGGVRVEVESPSLARSVYLWLDQPAPSRPNLGDPDVFADNYFDLLPRERKVILLKTRMSVSQVRQELRVTSLADAFQ